MKSTANRVGSHGSAPASMASFVDLDFFKRGDAAGARRGALFAAPARSEDQMSWGLDLPRLTPVLDLQPMPSQSTGEPRWSAVRWTT